MAYNIEFKFEKLNRCRQFLREFCTLGISYRMLMKENQSAYRQFRTLMEQLLKTYLCKRGYKSEMRQFLTMDSRDLEENPVAAFLQSKEVIDTELAAHFGLLFALEDGNYKTVSDLKRAVPVDNKRLWAVLKEYENLGIIERQIVKNLFEYRLVKPEFELTPYIDLFRFFAEVDSLGVAGHYMIERERAKFKVLPQSPLRFRHRFLYHVMDAEILESILTCIRNQTPVSVKLYHWVRSHDVQYQIPANYRLIDHNGHVVQPPQTTSKCWLAAEVVPVKIYASARTGRRYLMGYYLESGDFAAIRIDRIEEVKPVEPHNASEAQYAQCRERFAAESLHLWGVSTRNVPQTVHVEMEIMAPHPNHPVLARLESEKRCGTIERISPYSARFSADVYDGRELFPWLRSFTGYVIRISFSDPSLMDSWEKRS